MRDQPFVVTPEVLQRLTVDTQPWLSCDDCFELMDEYVERVAAEPGYVDRAMAAHLEGCSACADEAETLLELVRDEDR